MASEFLTKLQVEQLDDDDWILIGPLSYRSEGLNKRLDVPAGFITDFASVPRVPFVFWLVGGKAEAPAVLHDWFYRTNTQDLTRKQADDLLYEAIVAVGHWRLRAYLMWAGVRIGGYWSYETRSIHTTDRIGDS